MRDLSATDLTALLGSRICHDLISPIGAIGNGLELISMTGGPRTPEMALVTESVGKAQARIRYYRVAFGASRHDQSIGTPELVEILTEVHAGSRLQVSWSSTRAVSRASAKLAFLLIMCLESALPHGGRITVRDGADGWEVTGEGPRYRELPDVWPVLENGPLDAALSPDRVQFALARQQAAEMAVVLRVQIGPAGLRINAAPG
ncbi:histidine phosphotransferase [Meridianimarinicoccus roseus]|jgi:histidine phosphotransferase ChpT|uniref:Histidine phosphotransferase n=1 Tax=Meridianimarinicoccus roseus TaxID=2072018 RepID=A0A2V2LLV0_9RHOB|nr:histidine phosphotransferase family protein [Meridianimarinicoccus roseus]PWR04047.1 histidine phosphotransferase [Meridianimarinicoccus roseus]